MYSDNYRSNCIVELDKREGGELFRSINGTEPKAWRCMMEQQKDQRNKDQTMTINELLETTFDTDVTTVEDHDNLGWIVWNDHWAIVTS